MLPIQALKSASYFSQVIVEIITRKFLWRAATFSNKGAFAWVLFFWMYKISQAGVNWAKRRQSKDKLSPLGTPAQKHATKINSEKSLLAGEYQYFIKCF